MVYVGSNGYKVMNNGVISDFALSFKRVGYIQSGDGQYINTGYYPNNNTTVEFLASGISADSFRLSASGTWFLGGRQAYQNKMFGSYYNQSTGVLYFAYGAVMNSGTYSQANMYGDNKKIRLDNTGLYVNDSKIVSNTTSTSFTSPAPLILFALNNNGSALSFTGYKLHYCKIWDGDTLVRDYLPGLDRDNTPCLRDFVNNVTYYNGGASEFTYGN